MKMSLPHFKETRSGLVTRYRSRVGRASLNIIRVVAEGIVELDFDLARDFEQATVDRASFLLTPPMNLHDIRDSSPCVMM